MILPLSESSEGSKKASEPLSVDFSVERQQYFFMQIVCEPNTMTEKYPKGCFVHFYK
jgi:hypothetical protein